MLSNWWSKKLWSNLATVNTWYVFWNILLLTSTLNVSTHVQKTNMKNEKLITQLVTYTWCGRHLGIVVSELDPGLRVHIWDLSWSIHGQNAKLSPPRCNNCLRRGGGNLVMDWHPIQRGMMMHLVTSYEGKQDSLGLGGLLCSSTGLLFHLFSLWMFLFLKKIFCQRYVFSVHCCLSLIW